MNLLTTKDVAKIIEVTPQHVTLLVRTGKLKTVNPQCYSNFLFTKAEIEDYIEKKLHAHSVKSANISRKLTRIKKALSNEKSI